MIRYLDTASQIPLKAKSAGCQTPLISSIDTDSGVFEFGR